MDPARRPRVLIDERRLIARVGELAAEIDAAYDPGVEPTLVGVLKGSWIFLADLTRRMRRPHRVEFLTLSSYGDGREAREPRLLSDAEGDIAGRHVVIVDDICDSGRTLAWLERHLAGRGPASIRRCVLLDKRERREVDVALDHVGFEVDDVWLVGYGMDDDGRWRGLPWIGVLE